MNLHGFSPHRVRGGIFHTALFQCTMPMPGIGSNTLAAYSCVIYFSVLLLTCHFLGPGAGPGLAQAKPFSFPTGSIRVHGHGCHCVNVAVWDTAQCDSTCCQHCQGF